MVKQCWEATDGKWMLCVFPADYSLSAKVYISKNLYWFSQFSLVLLVNFHMFLESNSIVNIAFHDSNVKRSCQIFFNYSDSESFLDKCIIQTKLFIPLIPLKHIWGVIEMDQSQKRPLQSMWLPTSIECWAINKCLQVIISF